LIYRVIGESSEWVWAEEIGAAMEISLSLSSSPARSMGAFNGKLADQAWGDFSSRESANDGAD
jgi:hypothetical protein